MNKETAQLIDYINSSGFYLDKLDQLKKKFNNSKDYQNQLGYVIMEIVSTEKKFINMSRKNIDLPMISQIYFGGN